jgi:hypothetical protein
MPLTRIVNGVTVELSPEEEAAVRAEWEANAHRPPPVPSSVTPLQIRRALLTQGLLDDVQAFVEASPLDVRLAWEYAVQIDRHNELIAAAAASIGASSEEVDDLFRLAATL